MGVLDVEVTLDTGSLQDKIRQSTGSRGIRVSSSDGQIVVARRGQQCGASERAVDHMPVRSPRMGRQTPLSMRRRSRCCQGEIPRGIA